METEEKKLTSSEIDQMLEEAAAYHVESKEPSNKNKKNKKKKKKRKNPKRKIRRMKRLKS